VNVDVSDCTVFSVTHVGRGNDEIARRSVAAEILEQALQAISEVTVWTKTTDTVGKITPFTRQYGRIDVKFFFIEREEGELRIGKNPLFWLDRTGAQLMAGFLSNMVNTLGPASSPVPIMVRRVMASLDLVNLGFYTEAFVTLFSLVDDLTQEVLKAGLARKGISRDQQKGLLRAIREERLKLYLTQLMVLCEWKSMEDDRPLLFKDLVKVNALRNKIMHGSVRLTRQKTLEAMTTLLNTLGWLRENPFEYEVPALPRLGLAELELGYYPPSAEAAEAPEGASGD